MPFPRNTSPPADRTIHAALDLFDRKKQELCSTIESEHATPEEKYEALVNLAYMTDILTGTAGEAAAI